MSGARLLAELLGDRDCEVRKAAAEALESLRWQPANETQRTFWLVARQDWNGTASIGLAAEQPLLAALRDAGVSIRQQAALTLARIDDLRSAEALVPALLTALRDEDRYVRRYAARALGRTGDPRAIGPLVEALGDRDDPTGVPKEAEEALVRIGDFAVGPLVAALRRGNAISRSHAAGALRALRWEPADDSDRAWLYFAGWVSDEKLTELGRAAIDPCVDGLSDAGESRRTQGARVLGRIGAVEAVEPLVAALRREGDYRVRAVLVEALVSIGQAAVDPLVAALKEEGHDARSAAATALGRIGHQSGDTERVRRALEELLGHQDPNVRAIGAWALGDLGDRRAVEPLVGILRGTNDIASSAAACALGKIKDAGAAEALVEAFRRRDTQLSNAAHEALTGIGWPATQVLAPALKDRDSSVRRWVAKTLVKLGWEPTDDAERALLAVATSQSKYDFYSQYDFTPLTKYGEAALEALGIALADDNYGMRLAAARALGGIGGARAIALLVGVLGDPNVDVCLEAACELERLGWLSGNDSESARWAVARQKWEGVERYGAAAVEPLLIAAVRVQMGVRTSAEAALAKIQDPNAVIPLASAVSAKAHGHRPQGMFYMRPEACVSSLCRILESSADRIPEEGLNNAADLQDFSYTDPGRARVIGDFDDYCYEVEVDCSLVRRLACQELARRTRDLAELVQPTASTPQ